MIIKPRIVAVLGKEAARDVYAAGDADMIEVRLDLVAEDPLRAIEAVRRATRLPIIATNRLKSEGGSFEGSEEKRIELLEKASAYADYVDIELAAERRDELIGRLDMPVIVSYHDFARTPGREKLQAILAEMKGCSAALAKIAVTPTSQKDNLLLLDFLLDADLPLCMIAMGEMGRHLRAVAPIYGSVLTYGYISEATAPGQMSVRELRQALKLLDKKMP